MRKISVILSLAILSMVSCVDPANECATCYSVKENTTNGSIEDKTSEGTKCGTELDSLESLQPEYLDDYKYYYTCE
ncbi:MAG TPA: hypothetical protein PK734_03535 [Bacteroidales bacterium]|nr:MAG: hypothetical protein BWY22_00082 [Bacteroidetes bacterium ADurb.Bin217]HPM12545.1 hypothetical protein [Bacteroidales bacterium]